jgi:hypothetical protein
MPAPVTLTPGSAYQLLRPLHYNLRVQPLEATPVNAVAATGSVGTSGSNPANNNTITIGSTVYTFKTTLTPADGEVLIGSAADDTALNLAHAINATGGTPGTDYQVAAAHPSVSAATSISSNRFTVTARTRGAAGNSIALAKSGTNVSVNGKTTLEGGVDGTVGSKWEHAIDSSYLYIAVADNMVADRNWRRIALGSAF